MNSKQTKLAVSLVMSLSLLWFFGTERQTDVNEANMATEDVQSVIVQGSDTDAVAEAVAGVGGRLHTN